MKTLPTLYKLTSGNKLQMWTIGVDKNEIITQFGQVDGKIQRTSEVIKEGKNIGRSNETTPEEQALAEATSKWEGKIKKGYVEDPARAAIGEKDIKGGFDCMLAHKFRDHGHKIKYPVYVQPKLNGHRCLAVIDNGIATLWTRTRKPITSVPHIVDELQKLYPTGHHKVDGELYNHDYRNRFEDLASMIRQESPAPNCTEVQYHVYDKNTTDSFALRSEELYSDIHGCKKKIAQLNYIKFVLTEVVENEDELMEKFNSFLAVGYEGAMVRNADSLYVDKRSYDLQKIKEFLDENYPIVGIKEGKGTFAGCGIFICKVPTGETFDVTMNGPKAQLKEFLSNDTLWRGKTLTVQYQYISKYNTPIFPRGICFVEG